MKRHEKNLTLLISLTVAIRVAYLIFYYAADFFDPGLRGAAGHAPDQILLLFSRNDSGWYKDIFYNGYPHEDPADICYQCQSSWAFFPLYPALLKGMSLIFGGNFETNAFLFSLVIVAVMISQFYCFLTENSIEARTALFSSVFLLVFPFHYYFFMYYTEALFLTLVLVAFRLAGKGRWLWSSVVVAFLLMVRPNGIVCIPAVALYYLEKKDSDFTLFSVFKADNLKRLFGTGIKVALIPLTVFGAYCYYQFWMTGNPLAFSAAQVGWNRSFTLPVLAFFRQGDWQTQVLSVYTIVFVIIAFRLSRKQKLSMNLFMWFNILLPLSTNSVLSMPRFFSVNFPFQKELAALMRNRYLMLIVLFALQLFSFYFWVKGDEFSF